MNKEESIELLKDFIKTELPKEEWYQNTVTDISAILLYGSVARETNREDSDIDMLIFMTLEKEKTFTNGEYFYQYRGKEINIVIRSIEKLRKIASVSYNKFEDDVFVGHEIICERDHEIRDLIRKLHQKRP